MSIAYLSGEWFDAARHRLEAGQPERAGLDARIQFAAGPHRWVEVIADGRIVDWRCGELEEPDVEIRASPEAAWDAYRGAIDGTAALAAVSVGHPGSPHPMAPSPMDLGEQPELGALPVIPAASLDVQYEYTRGPWGDVSFGLSFIDGRVDRMVLGRLPEPDVTVTCSFLQMAQVRRGDIGILDVLAAGGTVAGREGPLALLGGISESPEFRRAEMACGASGRVLAALGEVHHDRTHVAALADLAGVTIAPHPQPGDQ